MSFSVKLRIPKSLGRESKYGCQNESPLLLSWARKSALFKSSISKALLKSSGKRWFLLVIIAAIGVRDTGILFCVKTQILLTAISISLHSLPDLFRINIVTRFSFRRGLLQSACKWIVQHTKRMVYVKLWLSWIKRMLLNLFTCSCPCNYLSASRSPLITSFHFHHQPLLFPTH